LTFSGHRGTVDGKYGIVYDIQMEQDPPGIQRCQLPATQGCRLAAGFSQPESQSLEGVT